MEWANQPKIIDVTFFTIGLFGVSLNFMVRIIK